MKKLVMFLALLIVTPFAFADWFYNSQNIVANVEMYGNAEVVPSTTSGYIESATINLTFFPKQTPVQELLKFDTNPNAEISDETLKFSWQRPEGKFDFSVSADIKVINSIIPIKQKIKFPIEEVPEELISYTKPSQTIDSDDEEIVRIASDLVKGEDDLYSAVFKIADWTKSNIEYDLSTLTAEVSQKASWVLENKQGVCDELTSLFIAMLRTLGIPARFVSGISYTDSPLFPEKWGPHGWAEVYFPNYGWVPFDVTYGEFGWIDPTHIKFKDSIDSDEPSTYYQWLGRNAELKTNKLDIKTSLIDKTGVHKLPLNVEASTYKQAVAFGSYNLIEASVENLNDFYYATEVYLSKPKEVNIIGQELKSILLLPGERKRLFWIVKLTSDLDDKFSYTFPLVVSTLNNISAETSFSSSIRQKNIAFEEVEKYAKLLEEEKEKKYSGNVVLSCQPIKNEFYEYEKVQINCLAKNVGNIFLDDLDVCFENKCNKISLGISQTKNVSFDIGASVLGIKGSSVTLRNDLVSKSVELNYKINDVPRIDIEELNFPVNVSYDEKFVISFTLTKKSESNPKNVEMIFAQNGFEKKWNIDEMTENRKFILDIVGNQLKFGANDYKIFVNYEDSLNKKYSAIKAFSITLPNVNALQRLMISLNNLQIRGNETLAVMFLTAIVAFIMVILLLFKRNRRKF